MNNCNYQEILTPQIDPNNTFVSCFQDIVFTFYIIDEFGGILQSDLGENFIYQGN